MCVCLIQYIYLILCVKFTFTISWKLVMYNNITFDSFINYTVLNSFRKLTILFFFQPQKSTNMDKTINFLYLYITQVSSSSLSY